jgi:hypothetical protein
MQEETHLNSFCAQCFVLPFTATTTCACVLWTGSYIANRVSDKLTPVCDRIYCCRSGSAADTQAISDMVKYYLDLHRHA